MGDSLEEKWIVAVSGGPDSMYLLNHLHQKGYGLVVAHVNYKMRPESDDEAMLVEEYTKELGHLFESITFNKDFPGNFQKAARDFRYDFFSDLVGKYNAMGVAIGHHLDDDLETYIMQKESKRVTDWPGLKSLTEIKGIKVWRPLLHISKKEILNYCESHGIPYAIDKSNFETNYTRNRIRLELSKLDRKSKQLLTEELYQEKEKQIAINNLVLSHKIKDNPFRIENFVDIPNEVKHTVLRNWLVEYGINAYDFTYEHIAHLIDLIDKGKGIEKLSDYSFIVSFDEVCLQGDVSYRYKLNRITYHETEHYKLLPTGETIEGLTLAEDDFPIVIRSPEPGDKIEMRFGTKRLSRFFIDRKIPIHERKKWLVIENCVKDIVFVSGLGCDVHHYSNNPSVFVIKL